jgi:hypothetical protein
MSKNGVTIRCERNPLGAGSVFALCLDCGHPFTLEAAVLIVRAAGERLGYIGPCCVERRARARFQRACRNFEKGGTRG